MKTNLSKAKETAISFLYADIVETELGAVVVIHPIFESGICQIIENNETKLVNIIEDKNGLRAVRKQITQRINRCKSVFSVYNIIRKSYRLTFLKYIKGYVSNDDFSVLFADAWVTSENPNGDANVSISELTKWFKEANKKVLMTDKDYTVYSLLPTTLKIYRGVATGRNPRGLSWTQNLDTAKWFANRWDSDGYIQVADINKDRVLAYFNTRNEDELVVDTKGLVWRTL